MLDKLSDALKNSMHKFISAIFVDETTLNQFVNEIQRALLQADVNVALVFKISEDIKKRAREEIGKGQVAKEHIIKIVYEELVKVLGEEGYNIYLTTKPYKILLIGLFGNGKCVHPNSIVPLADGTTLTAEEIYDNLSKDTKKELIDNAEICDVSNRNILIPSFNSSTLKIENKTLTHVWKLKGKPLLDVYLDNGNDFSVRVTPEHPFFVMRGGIIKQIKAQELNEDDFIATPNKCDICAQSIDLVPYLKSLDLDIKTKDKINLQKTVIEIHKGLPFKRNYCHLTINLKQNIYPFSIAANSQLGQSLNIKLKETQKFVEFPRFMTEELAEFIGYVFGDGHITRSSIEIVNEDPEVIDRVKFLGEKLFNTKVNIKQDTRTRAMYLIRIHSKTLAIILSKIFGIKMNKKGKNLSVPQQIFKSNNEVVRKFLRAYFDCDGYAAKGTRVIELTSESKSAVKGIQTLLLRFGIISTLSKKKINTENYWTLYIRARYTEKYSDIIGFSIKHKLENSNEFQKIGVIQGCGKQDMIPLGKILEETRLSFGFSIGEIQNIVTNYGAYEKKGWISKEALLKLCRIYKETKIGFIASFLKTIKNSENIRDRFSRQAINGSIKQIINYGLIKSENGNISVTDKGLVLLSQTNQFEKLAYLENVANSDVCWLRVSKIVSLPAPDYVYDFTVKDNHSFVADSIIVHNTTSAAKIAKFFQNRGNRVCILALDTFRAAAYEQLMQLGSQINVHVFGNPKEKNAVNIIKQYENEIKKYDVVIADSSGRDALKKDMIDEITSVERSLKPNEILLVQGADIGQGAKEQAEAFKNALKISGVVITKLDGTAKGGGAITACAIAGAPIKFIGVGEKINDLEIFEPKRFVSRLLGLGDIEALLEKAKELAKEKAPDKEMEKRLMSGKFNLNDYAVQLESMSKMGSLSKLMNMIPGMGMANIPKEMLNLQEDKLKKFKHILSSMTKEEKEDPDILHRNRIERIARGSGTDVSDVKELLQQFNQIKKLMKGLKGKDVQKLAKRFGGKMPKMPFGM